MSENTETLSISSIHIHPDIQVRTTINDDAVERYTELYEADSKALPPIKICVSQEDQHFYLIDGHHRLQAAKKAGLQSIQVIELGELSLKEMIHKSIEANGQQGIALSKADRKRAAEMLAKYDVNITVRDVAKRVGLSKSTVATILKEYREKTVVKCAECGATVLRLFADDPTNGWVEVQEARKSKWFCTEEHRIEFFAKQAEKEAEKQAKREQDEEARNAKLDDENGYGSGYGPEPEKDYTEELEQPTVTFTPNEEEDNEDDDDEDKVKISDDLKPCPFCGHQPSVFQYHDDGRWDIYCTNKDCPMTVSITISDSKEEAVKQWNSRQSDAAQENSFAEKLLKFLLKGYKWKQNGHEFTLQLVPNAFAGKDGFLVIRAGGLKGCAALQSTYLLPNLKMEAEK